MATTQSPRTTPDPIGRRPRGRRARRTAIAVAVAAACAVAIAGPLVLRGGHDPAPHGSATSPPARQAPRGALTGDVDGDGLADTVSLSHRGMLRVLLGSGTTVRQLVPGGTTLEGLAHVGPPGLDIATSERRRDGSRGSDWTLLHLLGTSLASVPVRHHLTLDAEPGRSVAWISGHTLYDGTLSDLQQGQDRVAVLARSWALRGGGLAPTRVGVRCWDRSTDRPPAPCAPGQQWVPDVGPHGDLPPLQPIEATWFKTATAPVVDGPDSWTLDRSTPPGPAEAPRMDLVLRSGDTTTQVLVPAGWPPVLRPRSVSPGAVHGVLISQEGGDSDTWRVYVDHDGHPVELRTDGPVALGGGFSRDGGAAYLSWVSDDGRIFTRVGTPDLGRYRLYEWEPAAATGTSLPLLRARDLGIVCFDDLYRHYGTCAD